MSSVNGLKPDIFSYPHFLNDGNIHDDQHHKKGVIQMKNKVMMGLCDYMIDVPLSLWEEQIAKGKKKYTDHISFMSREHRLVHHFVVRELPIVAKPLSPEFIANSLNISVERTISILDDLESHMTFIFRNADGSIIWAYPVTLEKTPHHVTFNTGEQLYAA
jgi:hypothetical protein